MNIIFSVAAFLLFAIGIAHSVIGEKLLIIPLLQEKSVELFKTKPYIKRVIRFAWHITTISWWGMALVVIDLAQMEVPSALSMHSLAGTSLFISLVIFRYTKGRHLSWIVFLSISICLWTG